MIIVILILPLISYTAIKFKFSQLIALVIFIKKLIAFPHHRIIRSEAVNSDFTIILINSLPPSDKLLRSVRYEIYHQANTSLFAYCIESGSPACRLFISDELILSNPTTHHTS